MSRNFADAISASDLTDATDSDVEPEAEKTHYLTYFAPIFNGREPRRQQAACGLYIDASEHSTEPMCDVCADYLQREADNDIEKTAADELGIEAP